MCGVCHRSVLCFAVWAPLALAMEAEDNELVGLSRSDQRRVTLAVELPMQCSRNPTVVGEGRMHGYDDGPGSVVEG